MTIIYGTDPTTGRAFPVKVNATTKALVVEATLEVSSITSVVNQEVQTSATGTTFVALADAAVQEVTIFNLTGTELEVRRGGAGVAIKLPTSTSKTFDAVTNASQLSLRRADTSNTQVTAQYELRS